MFKNKMRLMATCLSSCFLLGSCGGSDGGSLALDELAAELAKAFCAKSYTCCNATEIVDLEAYYKFTDEAACVEQFTGGMSQFVSTPMKNAVAEGRGQYDEAKAQKCLDAYVGLGCTGSNDPTDFFDACENPYQGLQATSAACTTIYECQEGNICSMESNTCLANLAANAACVSGAEPYCEATLYCDGAQCVTRKTAGLDCAVNECAAGLECDEILLTCTAIPQVCTGT